MKPMLMFTFLMAVLLVTLSLTAADGES